MSDSDFDEPENNNPPPSNRAPRIIRDMRKLRAAVGGVQAVKKAGGPNFAVKSAKELFIKLRAAIDKLKLNYSVIDSETRVVFAGDAGKGFQWVCVCEVTCRIESQDGTYRDFVGVGNGGDTQDKAAGKAFTYAQKSALIAALCAPDEEMKDADDEEPFEVEIAPRKAAKVVAENSVVVKDTGSNSGRSPVSVNPVIADTEKPVEGFIRMMGEAKNLPTLGVIASKIAAADWSDEEQTLLGDSHTAAKLRIKKETV